jgi:hypothetical protein
LKKKKVVLAIYFHGKRFGICIKHRILKTSSVGLKKFEKTALFDVFSITEVYCGPYSAETSPFNSARPLVMI